MTSWDDFWIKAKKPFCVFLLLATLASTSLAQGPAYGFTIVFILLAHEMGHYWMSKKYGVLTTWPYFIPMPNIFGTMGAVISMESSMPNRKALFDIGIAGPIAGIVLATPAMMYGLSLSHFASIPTEGTQLVLGEPLLFQWMSQLILGPTPAGQDIVLHPVAFAAWAVLFVTCLNMIPLGQLDGGHVMYAIFDKHTHWIHYAIIVIFTYLGIQYHPIWIFFLVVTILVSFKHPPPQDTSQPIGIKRILLAIGLYLILALCFTPIPFELKLN